MDRQPVSLASPRQDATAPSGTVEPGGPEVAQLREQVKRGDLAGLREYLAHTRKDRDWQDRIFVLDLVVPHIPLAAIDFFRDAEPEAADLQLIRCCFYCDWALRKRGTGTCDQVTEQRLGDAANCIQQALIALDKGVELDGEDPTGHAFVLRPLTIFGQLAARMEYDFKRATWLAPGLVPACRSLVNALAERWYGSHDQSLGFARTAMTKAGPGSDMAACLFWAHLLVQTHYDSFDNDAKKAAAYPQRPEVVQELSAAFDAWIAAPYTPRRSSIPYLHYAACWFYLANDAVRLEQAFELTGGVFCESPWELLGNPQKVYDRAQRMAAGEVLPPENQVDPCALCLTAVARGSESTFNGKLKEAEASFVVAVQYVKEAPAEDAAELFPLILLGLIALRQKQGQAEIANQLREQVLGLLDAGRGQMARARFQYVMAHVLTKVEEYRRALPYWEQAIRLAGSDCGAVELAGRLHNLGICYFKIGLRDHAAVPFRAAVKLYESAGDPRLAAALLNLGNALTRSSPAEAEVSYKRAADLHAERMQYQSATSAWVNLGILYSQQGRHAEAVECHERVLRVRQQSADTPPARIAGTLNNIACAYRRMGKFSEGHAALDRAAKVAPAGDPIWGHIWSSRGMIFLDAGEESKAVEWLRKAIVERRREPSPNLESIVEDLEAEIRALERLGRPRDTVLAREELDSARAELQGISQAGEEIGTTKAAVEGAVLIELARGTRPDHPNPNKNSTVLADRLTAEVRAQNAGKYSGRVAVPESTTLIFYGPDAEALFQVIEPVLMREPIGAGASVRIRQGSSQREVVLQREAIAVN